ncbi:hypothetical protein [Bdellovibrio sp. HCB337]|uniref:hypothetical protein n=1 Tax=Bdellovibrio sp. HCB337 TaxID=3394358 RepID=UPI0039A68547
MKMKFAFLGALASLLTTSVQSHGLTQQEFINECFSQVTVNGSSGPHLVCKAKTRADAEKLASIGIDPVFEINTTKGSAGSQYAQGKTLMMGVAVPVKGLVFKKYLRVNCVEELDSSVSASQGIIVDIENRVDFTTTANVNCD